MKLSHQAGHFAARSLARAIPKRLMCSPRYFSIWEESGYHVVPVYYESPVPQAPELRESLWQKPSEMVGIDLRSGEQLCLLEAFQSRFKTEYDAFPRGAQDG